MESAPLRIHHLQHVPFEDLGSMRTLLSARGHALTASHLYRGDPLPDIDTFDWLIVMGGPMGIADETEYPWLVAEKRLIREAIDAGRTVLGICLGAQLIAAALGARVYRGAHREIGWFELERHEAAPGCAVGRTLPDRMTAFHWHGDTFDIPDGALPLASSEACANQGFVFQERVVALQFHLETTPDGAARLVEHCADELDGSRYVQAPAEMLGERRRFATINAVMDAILVEMESVCLRSRTG